MAHSTAVAKALQLTRAAWPLAKALTLTAWFGAVLWQLALVQRRLEAIEDELRTVSVELSVTGADVRWLKSDVNEIQVNVSTFLPRLRY